MPEASTQGAAGALGFDLLAGTHVDVEFDFGHDRIALFSSNHCRRIGPYWANHYDAEPLHLGGLHEYYFDMTLNGKKLQTILATGSVGSVLFTNVSKPLYGFDEKSSSVKTQTSGTGAVSGFYRAMALSTEGLQVLNARIRLLPHGGCFAQGGLTTDGDGAVAFADCNGAHPLELGLSVLKKLRLYLAPNDGFMYFTEADAHNDADPAKP